MPKENVTVKQTIERLVGIISDIMADSVMGDPAQYKTTLSAKLTNDPAPTQEFGSSCLSSLVCLAQRRLILSVSLASTPVEAYNWDIEGQSLQISGSSVI